MIYKVICDGAEVNRVVADESFIKAYCAANGLDFAPATAESPKDAPTEQDRIAALEDAMLAMMGVTSDV